MRSDLYTELAASLAGRELVALATVVGGAAAGRQLLIRADGGSKGGLGSPALDRQAVARAAECFADFASRRVALEDDGGETLDVFFEVHPPPPRLVLVGAVHVAVHLIDFARILGFETVVVDPRTAFATPERFARADRLLHSWPQEVMDDLALDASTYVAALSHDLKIDLPALAAALASPARYVGALGSKKTHAKRVAALRELGVPQEAIDRIHSPIGFDLGGRRAEEIALAVMAEIVAASHGKGRGPR